MGLTRPLTSCAHLVKTQLPCTVAPSALGPGARSPSTVFFPSFKSAQPPREQPKCPLWAGHRAGCRAGAVNQNTPHPTPRWHLEWMSLEGPWTAERRRSQMAQVRSSPCAFVNSDQTVVAAASISCATMRKEPAVPRSLSQTVPSSLPPF